MAEGVEAGLRVAWAVREGGWDALLSRLPEEAKLRVGGAVDD